LLTLKSPARVPPKAVCRLLKMRDTGTSRRAARSRSTVSVSCGTLLLQVVNTRLSCGCWLAFASTSRVTRSSSAGLCPACAWMRRSKPEALPSPGSVGGAKVMMVASGRASSWRCRVPITSSSGGRSLQSLSMMEINPPLEALVPLRMLNPET
jgi:hypothetical protein